MPTRTARKSDKAQTSGIQQWIRRFFLPGKMLHICFASALDTAGKRLYNFTIPFGKEKKAMNENERTPLTEAEWKIMLRLWAHSPQTMMELTRSLAPETNWSKHTVITMLKRMNAKGTVHIDETGPVKLYTPAVSRNRVAQEQTDTLLNRLFGGRPSLLVSELLERGVLDEEEIEAMRRVLDRHAAAPVPAEEIIPSPQPYMPYRTGKCSGVSAGRGMPAGRKGQK